MNFVLIYVKAKATLKLLQHAKTMNQLKQFPCLKLTMIRLTELDNANLFVVPILFLHNER